VIVLAILHLQIAVYNAKNNRRQILSVSVRVVTKTCDSWGSGYPLNAMYSVFNAMYSVTFETKSGDRYEFAVPKQEYVMLAEGDTGTLTYQGTRYCSFRRQRS
jgi:Protein of unknown function (DUF2500)